jgi:hypothetical protein
MSKMIYLPIVLTMMLTLTGCESDENRRLAELAERQLQRQHEQNQRITEMHHEVAEGSRRLVEAEAKARKEMIGLQKEIQTERATVSEQRDALEQERRDFADQRNRDPIIAASIKQIGLLAACVLPLIICWLLLRQPVEPADDRAVAELLIADLVANDPLLFPTGQARPALKERLPQALPEPSDATDRSS